MDPRAVAPLSGEAAGFGGADPTWADRLEAAQLSNQAAADARAGGAPGAAQVPAVQIAQLRKVSQDFESVFLSYLMKVGRESVAKGDFLGHSQGEEIFTEMRDDELAKHMAKAGGIGLSKLLVDQLSRTLERQAAQQALARAAAGASVETQA